jgi:hypothetical protein
VIKLKGALLTGVAFVGLLALFAVVSFAQAYPEGTPHPVLIATVGLAVLGVVFFLIFKIPDRR